MLERDWPAPGTVDYKDGSASDGDGSDGPQALIVCGVCLVVEVWIAGDDPAAAAAAGFLQTNQGQWQPCSVEHTEVTDIQELERAYALPRPAEGWHVAPQAPESGSDAPHADPLTEEVALGAAR